MTDLETRCLGWAMALLSVGCSVFDERLIPPDFQVTDECKQDAVPVKSSNSYHDLDLTGFKNDEAMLPNCLDHANAYGKDFFLAVKMVKGDMWHFHAKSTHTGADGGVETLDPALFVLSSCSDVTRGGCEGYVNNCGSGNDEHLTFKAPSSQIYYVGVDYVGTTELPSPGSDVEVIAVQPTCGNGVLEHPEFCDDGNTDPTDGCDQCRQALPSSMDDSGMDETKNSKNDGPLDATTLLLDPDKLGKPKQPYTVTVKGTLTSDCDFDFYQFDLSDQPSPTTVTIALSGTDALCSHVNLKVDPSTPFELDPNPSCPTISKALDPTMHLVRVNALSSVTPPLSTDADKAYTLTLTFAPP